jgi:hypothetical protein
MFGRWHLCADGNLVGMYRQRVESSAVLSVGYDQKRRVLEVEVEGGEVYQYLEVPAREYFALVSAESVGRYYNQQIKANYDFRKA